jgi:hypothetical protein
VVSPWKAGRFSEQDFALQPDGTLSFPAGQKLSAVSLSPPAAASSGTTDVILSRAQRAHARLSWAERLARNVRVPTTNQMTIRLFGIPEAFASSLGLATV